MKLIPIPAGKFHCDGGALFGVIPKILWNEVYPSDEKNFTKLSLRCLLVESNDRKILIETGIGNHFDEKYLKNNGVEDANSIEESLIKNGYSTNEITDVIFTHLHWDHCSGAVKKNTCPDLSGNNHLEFTFKNAHFWCSKTQYEHSLVSNPRETAAFPKDIISFLFQSGRLNLIESEGELFPGISVRFYNGHTPGQIIPFIRFHGKTVVYMSDLIPTAANIPLLWIASYDLFPVDVMREKQIFLEEAVEKDYILFFEHDYYVECATVYKDTKGFKTGKKGDLITLLPEPSNR